MDEKGFIISIVQKQKRVFTHKYFKSGRLIGAAQDGNREWVTVVSTVCQDNTYLPPYIIYQALSGNIQDTWLNDYNPGKQECYFASTPKG
jgi:hypothetical protein